MVNRTTTERVGSMLGGAALGLDAGIRHHSIEAGFAQWNAPISTHMAENRGNQDHNLGDFDYVMSHASIGALTSDFVFGALIPFTLSAAYILAAQHVGMAEAGVTLGIAAGTRTGYNFLANFAMETVDVIRQAGSSRRSR